ncbi:acyl-CoA dehydrogenase family protein [Membranihabitans maritimus]|uniref:acyl-CoA dehydrogenase family protein n=1 Tax=Membranihabitans maritimus TaxID=2904244 RepID=UPI001F392BC0|nr:acyl-CoA dehydrogenase family protein [Membranihabitans maritimus]
MRNNINHLDYFNLESNLDPDTLLVRDAVRDWVDKAVRPNLEKVAESKKVPDNWFKEMAELGCFGPSLSEEHGGLGMSDLAYGLIMQELERGDSGVRSMASVQGALVMYPISIFGSPEQQSKYLKKLSLGNTIGCFGLTEPNHGSNPGGMETSLVKDGANYKLNGTKMWITNAPVADISIIWAKDTEGKVYGIILELSKKGVSVETIENKWSMRTSLTGTIYLDDVIIEPGEILPGARGLKAALKCLNKARYGIAWGVIGAAQDCYETARKYALERTQFGKPLAAFQLVQKKLAEMLTKITQAQALVFQLGYLSDSGLVTNGQISMAKRANVEMALDVARISRQILGAMGITQDYPIMRHIMNLETVITYEGTHDIHLLVTGQEITGISAFT